MATKSPCHGDLAQAGSRRTSRMQRSCAALLGRLGLRAIRSRRLSEKDRSPAHQISTDNGCACKVVPHADQHGAGDESQDEDRRGDDLATVGTSILAVDDLLFDPAPVCALRTKLLED